MSKTQTAAVTSSKDNREHAFEWEGKRYIAEYDGGAIVNGTAKDKYVIWLDRTATDHAYERVDAVWIKHRTLKRDIGRTVFAGWLAHRYSSSHEFFHADRMSADEWIAHCHRFKNAA